MRVVVDAFGGDNAPLEIIKGASLASNELKTEITLTGKETVIRKIIIDNALKFYGELKIVNTDDVISMHDEPTSLTRARWRWRLRSLPRGKPTLLFRQDLRALLLWAERLL